MKILHVLSGDLWAGAESQAFTLMTNLAMLPDVTVTAVLFNEGELASRLRVAGIRVKIIDEETHNFLSILLELYKTLREIRPDVVHTHRFKENVLGSIAALCIRGATSVRTLHGAPEHFPKNIVDFRRLLIAYVDRWCARHLQKVVIAVSNDLAIKFKGVFGRTPIVVVKNGVDVHALRERVDAKKMMHRHVGKRWVGFVGRLVPIKRVDLFLEIAAKLNSNFHDEVKAEFHIFGDGPLMAPLRKYSLDLGLGDSVEFHGHISDVQSNIAELDVLVICSDYEGLPMVALEALSLGTRVVAHRVGGLRDLLSDDFLVDHQDSNQYVEKIFNQLEKVRESHMENLLPAEYTASANAKSVRDIYLSIIDGRSPCDTSRIALRCPVNRQKN